MGTRGGTPSVASVGADAPVPSRGEGRTGATRSKQRANAVPLVAVLAGAAATVLWGCGVVRGGWLGIDVALTALGFMVARPSARPRGFRAWRSADGRVPVLRLGVSIVVVTLVAIVLVLQLDRMSTDSGVRGDLLAAGLQFADLRGAGGAPHALDAWVGAPTSQLWVVSLLVQLGVAIAIVRRLVSGSAAPRRNERTAALVAVAVALGTVAFGVANDWSAQAVLLVPWFRVLGVAAGFAAGRRRTPLDPGLERLWPVPLAVLAGLGVLTPAAEAWAPLAAVVAVAATAWLLLARRLELPAVERQGAWLAWAGAVAFVAGPPVAALVAGGSEAVASRGLALVVVVGASIGLGWESRVLAGSIPTGDLTRVVAPPVCVGLLALSLVSAGFFEAEPPKIVDPQRYEQPDGSLAFATLVDGLPAPDAFCQSDQVAQLGEHLGSMMVSIVDEDRASELLDETAPDWDPLLASSPDPTITSDVVVVRDQAVSLMPALGRVGSLIDQGDIIGLSEVIKSDPGVLSFLRLTFYLERRCGLVVSS